MDPEEVFESFRQALRESSLKDDLTGDFGVEAAVAAFDACLELAKQSVTPPVRRRFDQRDPYPLEGCCEISENDVGKPLFTAFGRHWPVASFMGRILPSDVGKRVFLRDDVLQVENDQQRTERLKGR